MFQLRSLHPVFRHGNVLVCLILAFATVYISGIVNPHSIAWLVGVYFSLAFGIEARRRFNSSPLMPSYCLYIFVMNQYLLLVWFLHIYVPGATPQRVKNDVLVWAHALGLGSIFLPVAMYRFTLKFSDVSAKVLRGIEVLGWVIAIALGILNFTGDFTREYMWTGVVWVPKVEAGYVPYFFYTSLFVMLTCAVPFIKMFLTKNREQRLKLFYYFIGAAPVYLTCWSHFLISLGINLYPFGGLFFVLHVVIIAYAVLFHQVFDIKIVVRRGLAYGAVSLFFGFAYAGLIILSSWLYENKPRPLDMMNGIIFVLVGGFLYAPLLGFLQKAFDRMFFRTEIDRQELFDVFAQKSASTIELPVLSELLCTLLNQTLIPRRIQLFIRNNAGTSMLYGEFERQFTRYSWPRSLPMPEFLIRAADDEKLSVQIHTPTLKAAVSFSEGLDGLLIPINNRGENLGFLFLEPKRADESYTEEDVRFVKTVAAHSAVAIQNARSFAEIINLQKLTTNVFDGLNVGVVVLDSTGTIIRFNDAAVRILNPQRTNLPSQLVELFEPAALLANEMTLVLSDGRPRNNKEISTGGSERRTYLFSSRKLHTDESGDVFLVLINDISDYREMERLAQRRGELAQLGEMVSGINHEIKNILQPIQYQVTRLAAVKSEDQTFHRAMQIIPDRFKALELLLENLRNLSRPIELRPRILHVPELIQSVLRDIKDLPSVDGIQFDVFTNTDANRCKADGHWLRLVLYNLIRNAVEATVGQPKRAIKISTAVANAHYRIQVKDSGKGIASKDMTSLFKPFFTTKAEAGTGLGLSISQKVIELHGGKFEVESTQGQGSSFTIVLPHDPLSY